MRTTLTQLTAVCATIDLSLPKDEHRLVLARGKRLLPFDQYRCKTEAITDDFAVTCACFNHTSLTILTATEKTVKVPTSDIRLSPLLTKDNNYCIRSDKIAVYKASKASCIPSLQIDLSYF